MNLKLVAGVCSNTKWIEFYSDAPLKITDAYREKWLKSEQGVYFRDILQPILIIVKDKTPS
jgi:hypothetical protein